MNAEPDFARLATAIGDPTRIRMLMLLLLMEGRALTAEELAWGAQVTPATTTAHLQRLLTDGLIVSTRQGRHKYLRLASADVARMLKSLMVVAPRVESSQAADQPILIARFCYDHLAGRLGPLIGRAVGLAFDVLRRPSL